MIFNRPHNVTFTQMAQWIDANSYNPERDDNKLVEYLYHIVYIKSEKCGFFTDYEKYDDFALYCISKFLIRFSNKQESPVKSVLNYLKIVLEPWHAEYVREFCYGSPDVDIADFNVSDFSDYLVDAASEYDYNSYSCSCLDIGVVARRYLAKIPVKKRSPEWSNICTSCLLTLHDRIKSANCLSGKNIASDDPQLLNRIIRGLKTKPPILFHIGEEDAAYVSVLVNEIIHALAVELTYRTHSKVSVTTCLQNLVKAANNDEDND